MNDADHKAVGYCCPPEHTRFQKGKSGNPAGRPKGRSFRAEARSLLNEPNEDGESSFKRALRNLIRKSDEGEAGASSKVVKIGFDLEKNTKEDDQDDLQAGEHDGARSE